jgi:hypothetical protein
LTKVTLGEAAAVLGGQVLGEAFQQGLAVPGPRLAPLLEFDQAAADVPVRRGEEAVDRAGGFPAGLVE